METYSLQLTLSWFFLLWLLGWLLLPLSRVVFPHQPDGGLAVGRVLGILATSLIAFWGASLHWISLQQTPWLTLGVPLAVMIGTLWHWRLHPSDRTEFILWLKLRHRTLALSDLIFVTAFLGFVLLRALHPALNEFEKPMDSAILGVLARADFLPAENPWFAGQLFTNYYYFGHFCGALMMRALGTPLPYAYNLVQPAFCALFLSALWALGAALCRSTTRGVGVMAIVGLAGNFEPLRQWCLSPANLNRSASFPFLDWWSTSRVIEHTINEYPFFTLALGDAHAHFFALAMTCVVLCACYELWAATGEKVSLGPNRSRSRTLAVLSLGLGALILTNPWDFPIYWVLACASAALTHPQRTDGSTRSHSLFEVLLLTCTPLLISILFLSRYRPQIGGFAFERWLPPSTSLLLVWGGFLLLWIAWLFYSELSKCKILLALCIGLLLISPLATPAVVVALLILLAATLVLCWRTVRDIPASATSFPQSFILLLAACGLLMLLAPHFVNLNGYFSGALRHQDTVFKWGLQSWMLLGLASTSALLGRTQSEKSRIRPFVVFLLWLIPCCASLSVIRARSASSNSAPTLTLNSAEFLPPQDQQAVQWLANHAPRNSLLIEPVGRDSKGDFVGAYGHFGLISALAGVPAYVGWPQHARFWGARNEVLQHRLLAVEALYEGSCFAHDPLLSRRPLYCYSSLATRVVPTPPQTCSYAFRLVFRAQDAEIWEILPRKRQDVAGVSRETTHPSRP